MSEVRKPISTLVVKSLIGEATPAERIQLEEWASLSVENWLWIERFKDPHFIMQGISELEEIDLDQCARDFKARLHLHRTKKAKVKRIRRYGYVSVAVILLFILGSWLYKFLLRDKAQQLAQTSPAATSSAKQPEAKGLNQTPPETTTSHQPAQAGVHKSDRRKKPVNHKKPPAPPARQPAGQELPAVTTIHVPDSYASTPAAAPPQQPAPQLMGHRCIPVNSVSDARQAAHKNVNKARTILRGTLPDQSAFVLNAASAIYYPGFEGSTRKITLNGEALFNVVYNKSRSFFVAANGVEITTDSGSFNVRSYRSEQQMEITALTTTLQVAAHPYTTTLEPGETACISLGSPIDKNNWNTDKITAYSNRLFYYDNDNLNRVARELARWYGLTLVGADNANIQVSFQGLRTLNAEEVINKLVTSDGKQHLRIEGGRLIIE